MAAAGQAQVIRREESHPAAGRWESEAPQGTAKILKPNARQFKLGKKRRGREAPQIGSADCRAAVERKASGCRGTLRQQGRQEGRKQSTVQGL